MQTTTEEPEKLLFFYVMSVFMKTNLICYNYNKDTEVTSKTDGWGSVSGSWYCACRLTHTVMTYHDTWTEWRHRYIRNFANLFFFFLYFDCSLNENDILNSFEK